MNWQSHNFLSEFSVTSSATFRAAIHLFCSTPANKWERIFWWMALHIPVHAWNCMFREMYRTACFLISLSEAFFSEVCQRPTILFLLNYRAKRLLLFLKLINPFTLPWIPGHIFPASSCMHHTFFCFTYTHTLLFHFSSNQLSHPWPNKFES